MAVRFHKQIRLGELVKLNINKKSASLSVGFKGVHFNIGPKGPMIDIGIPGTGLSYRKQLGKSKEHKADAQVVAQSVPPPAIPDLQQKPDYDPDTMGDVPPLRSGADWQESAFHMGASAYTRGNFVLAYKTFSPLIDSPYRDDARFMSAITATYLDVYGQALDLLRALLEDAKPPLPGEEGSLVERYLRNCSINIQITQFTSATLPLDMTAALFLYVELLQLGDHIDEATRLIADLFRDNPKFRLAQLSLADLLMQQGRYDDIFKLFSTSTPELKAEDDASVEIMYYWALALTAKGLYDAAALVYKRALARKKGINPDLRRILRYGRADLYLRQGKKAMARKYYEQIFAEAPVFLDVPQRIAALSNGKK
jgi:tetratricopeptide (TPR) repeat protein